MSDAEEGLGAGGDGDAIVRATERLADGRQRVESPTPCEPILADARRFVEADGIPDVPFAEVDAQLVADALAARGALVVRSMLPEEAVQGLGAELEIAEQHRQDVAIGALDKEKSIEAFVAFGGLAVSPQSLDVMFRWYREVGLARLVADYFREPPVVMSLRTQLLRSEPSPGLNWHQDAAFLGGISALNAWTALTPAGRDRPGVEFIPHRFDHVVGLSDSGNDFEVNTESLHYMRDRGYEPLIEEELRRNPSVEPELNPGDALLFDEMTVHRTGSTQWRAPFREAAITWFFAPSRFPNFGAPYAI